MFVIRWTLNSSIFMRTLLNSIFFDKVLNNSINILIDFVVLLSRFSIINLNINLNKFVIKTRLFDF